MKKRLLAAAAAITVFGGVYSLAAALNLTSDSLGAADTVVAACQSGAMNATYTSTYSAAVPGYSATTVTVTGLTAACYSKPFKVTLSGAANASLGEVTGTTPSSGTSFAATPFTVNAASVTGVAVVISG